MTPAERLLADAYRDWLQLILDEAAGRLHPAVEYREAYALIRAAEQGVTAAVADAVYLATKIEWEAVMRVDPLTGKPKRAAKPSPQARLL